VILEGRTANLGTLPRPQRLHHDGNLHPLALGCTTCPDLGACGGLRIAAATYSCLDRCCGGTERCDAVCPGNRDFAQRVREIGGFDMALIPRAPEVALPPLPLVVPLIYGGTRRLGYSGNAVALPLSKILRRGEYKSRFDKVEDLAAEFHFNPDSTILLSGTDEDQPLERWWNLEKSGRRKAVRAIVSLGVHAATSLNFSMFIDRPRHDDLHSAKRIAIAWQEMVDEGLPTALHVNARTEDDWLRWTDFISSRPEVSAISYEFATPARIRWHAERLVNLGSSITRPLRLIIRGGRSVWPMLSQTFPSLTVVDTVTYLKTIKRQCAILRADGILDWKGVRTPVGQPLDDLFNHNMRHVSEEIRLIARGAAMGQDI
jgi:hypothetical protein